ncbi:hypothetical protein D3C71_1982930 [compost metagenome]
MAKVLAQPDFRERFQTLGLVIQAPRDQAQTDSYVAEDRERWGTVIRANNIKLD